MDFKFRDGANVSTSEPHYDLFDGGYIKPSELLEDADQAAKVEEAVKTVRAFLSQAEDAGVIELY